MVDICINVVTLTILNLHWRTILQFYEMKAEQDIKKIRTSASQPQLDIETEQTL